MPPTSPLASLARWFVPLQTVLLYGAPALVVGWPVVRRRSWTDAQLIRTIVGAVAIYLLLAAAGWYVDRDYSGRPLAAMASTFVVVFPALAAAGWVWRVGQRRGWSTVRKISLSIMAGYTVGAALAIPSLVVFVMLGGDTL